MILFAALILVVPVIILGLLFASRLTALEKRAERLESEIVNLKSLSDEHHPLPPSPDTRAQLEKEMLSIEAQAAADQPVIPPSPPEPSRTKQEWEALIGGKLMNRIGALALTIGVGFFLKYAFDNHWLPETARVLVGILFGLALLGAAHESRKRNFPVFAQGLVGAGISILYLSVFASYNFNHILSQPVAFFLMAAVTVISFTWALAYDSLAVSLLGWAGGFLTPFLLSSGQANEIGLFSYITLLSAGMLIIVLKKEEWLILEPLTLGGTYIVYFLWFNSEYQPQDYAPTLVFAILFWLLFHLESFTNALRGVRRFSELRVAFAALNALLFFTAMERLINVQAPAWMGSATFLLALIYLGSALALNIRLPKTDAWYTLFMFTFIVFTVIATGIEFSSFTAIFFWSAELLALAGATWRWKLPVFRNSTLGLAVFTPLALMATGGALALNIDSGYSPIFNLRFGASCALILSTGLSARLVTDENHSTSHRLQGFLHILSLCTFVILLSVEVNDYFRYLISRANSNVSAASPQVLGSIRHLSLSAVWLMSSIFLMAGGIWRRIRAWRVMAIAFFGVTILKIFIYDLSFLETLYRIFSFIGLGIILLGVSYFYQRFKENIQDDVNRSPVRDV